MRLATDVCAGTRVLPRLNNSDLPANPNRAPRLDTLDTTRQARRVMLAVTMHTIFVFVPGFHFWTYQPE